MFQSTPAITGERAQVLVDQSDTHPSFNPRPPLLASEPISKPLPVSRRLVSIHARHYWRASRLPLGCSGTCGRVSIHARHYWRASRAPLRDRGLRQAVSIHARHYWRASLAWSNRPSTTAAFQSTPAITVERALLHVQEQGPQKVSIHARHYWRASRCGEWTGSGAGWFQSTPAITGERAFLLISSKADVL